MTRVLLNIIVQTNVRLRALARPRATSLLPPASGIPSSVHLTVGIKTNKQLRRIWRTLGLKTKPAVYSDAQGQFAAPSTLRRVSTTSGLLPLTEDRAWITNKRFFPKHSFQSTSCPQSPTPIRNSGPIAPCTPPRIGGPDTRVPVKPAGLQESLLQNIYPRKRCICIYIHV